MKRMRMNMRKRRKWRMRKIMDTKWMKTRKMMMMSILGAKMNMK